jgi:hypothetical protein
MAKKIKEQIEYGNRPERMDPELERKLAKDDSLYGQNPAMRRGAADVQRLVSSRFQKVAEKLSRVTGIENLSSQQVQAMIYSEMMQKLPRIMSIESRHKEELEELAKSAALEEMEVPEDWFAIEAQLNRGGIDTSNFRKEADKEEKKEKNQLAFQSFDVEDLTDEEEFELEKHKRNLINAIVQGSAKKGHYMFQKPEIKSKLDEIDPFLYDAYLGIMAINDYLYFSMEQMIEMMSKTGNGVAGKVQLEDNDDDEGGEEGEEKPDTKIVAQGLIFPILCHEIVKGIEEAKGRYGLPQSAEMRQRVMGQTDTLSNEPMQLRIGPEIVEKIRNTLPDEMFEPQNKGLINWFHIQLYQLPATEFLKVIGDVVSTDGSKNQNAADRFREIMKEAQQLKQEYEEYQEEQGEDPDDDDNLDDFLNDLGIMSPN